MAQMQKSYPQSCVLLYNLANDVVEMYKGQVMHDSTELFEFEIEMYGKKTPYRFSFTEQSEGSLLSIETPGEGNREEQRISFMFSIVDNILTQIEVIEGK